MTKIKKISLFFCLLMLFLCQKNIALSKEEPENILPSFFFERSIDTFTYGNNTAWNIHNFPLYASNDYLASDRYSNIHKSPATAVPPFLSILLLDDSDCNNFSPTIFYTDNFGNGNMNEWEIIDENENPDRSSDWQIVNGKFRQIVNRVDKWELSYHLGSFAYYDDPDAFNRSNYHASARLRALSSISDSRDSLGIMVRYQNPNNYLRVLISKMQGFVRLEKKVNGVFSSLAFNGRPPELGSEIDLAINLINDTVFVYVNNEPVFSFSDPDDLGSGKPLGRGTIALFTQSAAEFSNIVIRESNPAPRLVISEPMAYSVASTDENSLPHKLNVTANAANVPSGGGVQFTLNGGSACNDFNPPYSTDGCAAQHGFKDVSPGEHRVNARIINSSGAPIWDCHAKDRDANTSIGIGGKYIIMLGDSITNGVGDDSNNRTLDTQNNSANGKNLNRGIAPVLNDLINDHLISSGVSLPVVVYNEGLGGTTSQNGFNRLESTINRHKKDQLTGIIWLILFGTNDSSTPLSPDIFKNRMNNIISEILDGDNGDIPILGKVPYVIGANATRLEAIQNYNIAIDELTDELTMEHGLATAPPDFYNHFLNNPAELDDDVHPNGIGYGSMAKMWFCELISGGFISGTKPNYCDHYQY